MNLDTPLKKVLAGAAVLIVAIGAITFGALTTPEQQNNRAPAKPTASAQQQLNDRLDAERPTIMLVLESAYPKVTTDYIVSEGAMYDGGKWYGTTLTYKGTDTANRDTLRVLMQKKDGVWIMRTTPPEPLLSAKKYADVPASVLRSINQPVSLPGAANSPTIN